MQKTRNNRKTTVSEQHMYLEVDRFKVLLLAETVCATESKTGLSAEKRNRNPKSIVSALA